MVVSPIARTHGSKNQGVEIGTVPLNTTTPSGPLATFYLLFLQFHAQLALVPEEGVLLLGGTRSITWIQLN